MDKMTAEAIEDGGLGEELTPEDTAFFESGGEEQATTEAPEATTEPEKTETTERQNSVPYDALHSERERRKESDARAQAAQEKLDRLYERWEKTQAAETKEPEEEPWPDPNVDIFAYNKRLSEELAKTGETVKQLESRLAKEDEEYKQESEQAKVVGQLESYWNASHAEYKEKNPDLENAQKWAISELDRLYRLEAMNDPRNANPAFRRQRIIGYTLSVANAAKEQGVNAAEMMYEYAKEMGYKPQTGENKVTENLERVSEAQKKARGVGNAAGTAGGDEIDLPQINQMDEDEFDAWVAVPKNRARWNQLMVDAG